MTPPPIDPDLVSWAEKGKGVCFGTKTLLTLPKNTHGLPATIQNIQIQIYKYTNTNTKTLNTLAVLPVCQQLF